MLCGGKITKVSEIEAPDMAEYLRLDEPTASDVNLLETLLDTAKAYVRSYTGRTEEQLDESHDFVIVVLILVQDMWDNRTLYVEDTNVNQVVEGILAMHSVNYLPDG